MRTGTGALNLLFAIVAALPPWSGAAGAKYVNPLGTDVLLRMGPTSADGSEDVSRFGPVTCSGGPSSLDVFSWEGFGEDFYNGSEIVDGAQLGGDFGPGDGPVNDKVLHVVVEEGQLAYPLPRLADVPAKISVAARLRFLVHAGSPRVSDENVACGVSMSYDFGKMPDVPGFGLFCRTDDGPAWIPVQSPDVEPVDDIRFYDIRVDVAFSSSGTASLAVNGHAMSDSSGRTSFPLSSDFGGKVVSAVLVKELAYLDSMGGEIGWTPDWFPTGETFSDQLEDALSRTENPLRVSAGRFDMSFPAPYAGTYGLLGSDSPCGAFSATGDDCAVESAGDLVRLADTNAVGNAKFYRVRFSSGAPAGNRP